MRPGARVLRMPQTSISEHDPERIGAFHVGPNVASVPVETLTE
jgi:hypothetical protein